MSDLDIMERLIGEARAGEVELSELIDAFLGLTVMLPSSTDPAEGGVTPVFVDIEGVPYIAVATSSDALAKTSALAQFAVSLSASAVLAGVAPGLGLQINTVHDSISFAPEILADLQG